MGVYVKVRLDLVTCGTCGNSRGIRHTCVTSATSKRRKTRAKVRLRLAVACGKCGKARVLRHTCTIRTDFKKRLRRKARAVETAERRTRAAVARAKREALRKQLKAEAKTKRKRPRATPHDPATCRLPDCDRYGCKKYREGFVDGHEDGYDEGFPEGFEEGIAKCPRPHGVA
jgi:hypothetical protein